MGHRPFNKVGLSTFNKNIGTNNPGCYTYFMGVTSGPNDAASCARDCIGTCRRRFTRTHSIGGLCNRRGTFHCLPLGGVILHLFPKSGGRSTGVVTLTTEVYRAPLDVDFRPNSSHATTLTSLKYPLGRRTLTKFLGSVGGCRHVHAYKTSVPVRVCRRTTHVSGCVTATGPIGSKHIRLVRCVGRRDVSFRCRHCNDVLRIPPMRWLFVLSNKGIA